MEEKGKEIQVDFIDTEKEEMMKRDSALEMEMLELFEDITLEDVVASKACVGKAVGCKDMPASVVKKILGGVWRRLGFWRMKKCEEGVLGFFFDDEDDFHFVMEKRPWIINGVLLNLKPWSVEGEVRVGEFEVAQFWVQFHGLPTRFLSNDNVPILAKKVGNLVRMEEKRKDDLVQFKYEKLPHLCFNCGKLAHWDKICSVQTTMVYPTNGVAVPIYGTWIKSETGRLNCFNSGGKGTTRSIVVREEIPEWDQSKSSRRKTWKRNNNSVEVSGQRAIGATSESQTVVEKGTVSTKDKGSGQKRKGVHGGTSTTFMAELQCTGKDLEKVIDGISLQPVMPVQSVENVGNRQLEVVTNEIGPNYLNIPTPDFSLGPEDSDSIPDIGPTIAQTLDIPHSWLCRSQRPHDFPEPTPIRWPNDDLEAQKMFFQLYGSDATDLYKAQPSLICSPPDLSMMITHLLGTKKRKPHTWYQPYPAVTNFQLPACPVSEVKNDGESLSQVEPVDSKKFSMGAHDNSGSRTRKSLRRSTWRSNSGATASNRGSGVKTRRGRRIAENQNTEINGGGTKLAQFSGRGGGLKRAPTIIMRCLSWNCRGILRPTTERTLRGLIHDTDAEVVFLAETKVGLDDMYAFMNRLGFVNVIGIPSVGIRGGFCLAWRQAGLIEVQHIFESGFHVIIPEMHGLAKWHLFCIYGTPYVEKKEEFWKWLTDTVSECGEPWVVIGDLNVILDESEKRGGRKFLPREGTLLRNFLDDTGGVDLGFQGVRCTWQNARKGIKNVRKRLDRGLADSSWCINFPNAKVINLPILGSDHSPILLMDRGEQRKLNYPFRFLEVWTSSSDCEKVVESTWNIEVRGRKKDRVLLKLANTKRELKKWNQNSFGFCDQRIRRLKRELV
ncbi:hypothetical protein F8388_023091 [Cannabis sativa]|uniref:CCHC-type domain-containing protein n=1 Tax=Cannabis sativa TaxID=3483 RepID=A0A7J6FMA4_CANSA|nr:hypothetical protein F8388_023091 [Cannabis sativa]